MELFAIGRERIGFLLEAEAYLRLTLSGESVSGAFEEERPAGIGSGQAQGTSARGTGIAANTAPNEGASAQEELPPDKHPKYIKNYIGTKHLPAAPSGQSHLNSVLSRFRGCVWGLLWLFWVCEAFFEDLTRPCNNQACILLGQGPETIIPVHCFL